MNLLRSRFPDVREAAAISLMNKQRVNLAALRVMLEYTTDKQHRQILNVRIEATTKHIDGWLAYIEAGCPLEPRAQVRLNTYPQVTEEMFA
ncbi:hypothetical protein GCM10010149_88500 [Nonomuraea roseoviolacea subsp. roseoviolacea]|uniref:hypothetical protein n=1 Tax=Nonomuraea roseoviolacea TaxID=103837 RepID=UPI0031DD6A5D